jgi:hypothetical protein
MGELGKDWLREGWGMTGVGELPSIASSWYILWPLGAPSSSQSYSSVHFPSPHSGKPSQVRRVSLSARQGWGGGMHESSDA